MAADISSNLYDWSTTAGSNQPDGSDSLTNLDDNLREMQAVLRGFLFSKGADIAAATEPDPKVTGLLHVITGTTTISGFATAVPGMWKIFKFAANPVLKNSTAMPLPGATDIQAATGDYMMAISTTTTGIWNVPAYLRGGLNVPSQQSPVFRRTATATTSGTTITFSDIPSWVNRITIALSGVSTNGTSIVILQIGDSGGLETSGYTGAGCYVGNAIATGGVANSTGFALDAFAAAFNTRSGVATLQNMGGNKWAFQCVSGDTSGANCGVGGGVKTLTGTLTQIALTTVNGTDAFDAGSVNILYE